MSTLSVTYDTFELCRANTPYWVLEGEMYRVVSTIKDKLLVSVASEADATSFAAVKLPEKECVSFEDACARALLESTHVPHIALSGLDTTPDADGPARLRVQPVTVDRGLWHWWHSAGDTAAGRGAGDLWVLSSTGDETTLEWGYNDWVSMIGGVGSYINAGLGDYVSFSLVCPATQGVSTPGAGNANKVAIPGTGGTRNIFVPAVNGDWTLDLESRDTVPVYAQMPGTGFWEWNWPDTGLGEVTPVADPTGHFALFDFAIDPVVRFVPKVTLLGNGTMSFKPENVKPSDLLPHWKLRCTLHHSGADAHRVDFTWHVIVARKDTK